MKNLKFRFLLSTFLVILLDLSLTKSQSCAVEKVDIICEKVTIVNYHVDGIVLRCNCESLKVSTAFASVSSVLHKNESEILDLSKIEELFINRATVKFIPNRIKSKLTKLKVLWIDRSGLLSVDKENLKQFGDSLEYLSLKKNEIAYIDADLFEYNTNLKYIELSFNPLRHIVPGFFENLRNLKNVVEVHFDRAGCIDQYYFISSGQEISKIKWNSEKCNDVTAMTETENLIKEEKLKFEEEYSGILTTGMIYDHKKSKIGEIVVSIDCLEDKIFSLALGSEEFENYEELKNLTETDDYIKFLL